MAKVKKLILVGANWEKATSILKRICESVAKDAGVEYEYRDEDWNFLLEHGEKDEFGGVNIPQVFVEYEDGEIKHILTNVLLTDRGKTDIDGMKELIAKAIGG